MHMHTTIFYLSCILLAIGSFIPITSAQVNVTNTVVVADTVLVWEAQTYTPPFYKGKALLPDGGDVRILAFPPTDLGSPYGLSYTWRVDGTVIPEASGIGRSVFMHRSDMFGGSPLIVVDVSLDGKQASTGAIRVPLIKPRVLLYPSLPLAGILFSQHVGATEGDEVSLEAYPLFFSVKSKADPALSFRWEVDGVPAQNPLGNSGRLILRSETGGTAALKLTIHNEQNILEAADGTITLRFEE